MQNQQSSELFDALGDLLEQERTALLAGDLEKISRLFEVKESLIEELSELEQFESQSLNALQGKVKRNQELLDSALEAFARSLVAWLHCGVCAVLWTRTNSRGAKQSIEMDKDGSWKNVPELDLAKN